MSSATSLEIVIAVVFLLALLLPMTFRTQVSAPRSALDVLSGFSKFNLSLSTLLLGPAIGLGLVVVVGAHEISPDPITNFRQVVDG